MADPTPTTTGTFKSGAKFTQYNFSANKFRPPTTPVAAKYNAQIPLPTAGQNVVFWSDEKGTQNYIPVNDAYNMYALLGKDARAKLNSSMDKFYGRGRWDSSWIPKFWARAVNTSAFALQYQQKNLNPLDAFDQLLAESAAYGVGPDGAGSGGGGRGGGPTKQVNLTDPSTAKTLVDQALQSYLGRAANQQEVAAFTKALTAQEMANPKQTKVQGDTTVVSGGINPQTFAQEYAQSQEGSAEYQAATTFLDAFIQSLDNPIGLT